MKYSTLKEVLATEDRSLCKLISLLADLSSIISREIPRRLGTTENVNVYDEKQLNLDVWANDLLAHRLLRSGLVKQVASEELDRPMISKRGEYSVVFDPVDGSSNIESNNLIGTIVGIYRDKPLPAIGRDLIASMYFLYGPYLKFVLALEKGVHILIASGKGSKGSEKFLSNGQIHRFPKEPRIYGVGGLRERWPPRVRGFVELLEKRRLTLRYGGSLVGDFNQVLSRGGFFAYPELVDAPNGKYRLQCESNPIAFITEKAGGKASTGTKRILDIEPTDITQRVPTYLGNWDLVTEFEKTAKINK